MKTKKGGKREGAGRKKAPYKTTTLSFRVKIENVDKIKTLVNAFNGKEEYPIIKKLQSEIIKENESADSFDNHNLIRLEVEARAKAKAYENVIEWLRNGCS